MDPQPNEGSSGADPIQREGPGEGPPYAGGLKGQRRLIEVHAARPGWDHIGSAVAFYCTDGRGRWLLHQRGPGCRDYQGAWDCGGGRQEFGETVEASLFRELQEEYGCSGEILERLDVVDDIGIDERGPYHWLTHGYLLRIDPGAVRVTEVDKIQNLEWLALDDFPDVHPQVTATLRIHEPRFRYWEASLKSAGPETPHGA